MSDLSQRCLDAFPTWLRTLGDDATALATLLTTDSLPDGARRYIAGGLNYLFKSLDLIPDGVEDLGYLDDAFVLRFAAAITLAEDDRAATSDPRGVLARLAGEATLVYELLGADASRLESYVMTLTKGAARGRTVDEIVSDAAVRAAFVSEVHGWSRGYEAPSFTSDERTLTKLKSFLTTRLPKA